MKTTHHGETSRILILFRFFFVISDNNVLINKIFSVSVKISLNVSIFLHQDREYYICSFSIFSFRVHKDSFFNIQIHLILI